MYLTEEDNIANKRYFNCPDCDIENSYINPCLNCSRVPKEKKEEIKEELEKYYDYTIYKCILENNINNKMSNL